MKRSRILNLMLLGVALTACDQKKPDHPSGTQVNGQVFKDETDCQKAFAADVCHKAFEDSKKLYEKTAPKFNSREECEKLHGVGKCTEGHGEHGGGGIFMPMMMGYMLGNMLGGRTQAAPVSPGGAPVGGAAQRGGFGSASSTYSSSSAGG